MHQLCALILAAAPGARPVPLPFETTLPGDGWEAVWADSRWGREYYLAREPICADGFRLEGTEGRSSGRHKPWLTVHQPATGL